MAGREGQYNFKGVTRDQEVRVKTRRLDTRGFWERAFDSTSKPSGTITLFAMLFIISILGAWIPFFPEIMVLVSLLIYRRYYRYKKRIWSAPFRVPGYLKVLTGRDYIDETTGKPGNADVYLGFCLETRREVWGSLDDVRTHRLTCGTTGSGKTEELLAETFNALVHDSGVMFIDGKGEKKGSLAGILTIARLFWRDEDVYQLNYVMGGEDAQLFRHEKRSNTFNPLQNMGSSAMAEIMISLLSSPSSGDSFWQDRAIALIQGLIPPLNYLAKRGYLVLNAEVFSAFLPFHRIEDLFCHKAFVNHQEEEIILPPEEAAFFEREYLGALRIYLNTTPGWERGPNKPFLKGAGGEADPNRAEVLKQHGYLVMQVLKPVTDLAFNYGHIYNVTIGEIDFKDMALNRRILGALLPALERSEQNMKPLGKMAVAAVKNTLATSLAGQVAGSWREVMASPEVARGPVPYFILCDEYTYYVVEGFAVAPAQARSLGYAITFGLQNIDGLMKTSESEGAATIENTNIAIIGRMTAGKDSATYKVAEGRAGDASVQLSEEQAHKVTSLMTERMETERSRLTTVSRVSYDDMAAQKDGDFTLIIGTPVFTKRGVDQTARVVRMKSFYTGQLRNPDAARPLDCAFVMPMTVPQIETAKSEMTLKEDLGLRNRLVKMVCAVLGTDESSIAARFDKTDDRYAADPYEYLARLAQDMEKPFEDMIEGLSDDELDDLLDDWYHTMADARIRGDLEKAAERIEKGLEMRGASPIYLASIMGRVRGFGARAADQAMARSQDSLQAANPEEAKAALGKDTEEQVDSASENGLHLKRRKHRRSAAKSVDVR